MLADRAVLALRPLEGSPLPLGCCIHRQQTSLAVQIHTERRLLLQHCLEESKAVAWITVWLTKAPAGKAFADKQLWHDFVALLARNRVN